MHGQIFAMWMTWIRPRMCLLTVLMTKKFVQGVKIPYSHEKVGMIRQFQEKLKIAIFSKQQMR